MTCTNGHVPIEHEEFYCPLCVEIEDRQASEDKEYETTLENDRLMAHIDNLGLADTMQLLAKLQEQRSEIAELKTALYDIRCAARKGPTLTKRLERVGQILLTVR